MPALGKANFPEKHILMSKMPNKGLFKPEHFLYLQLVNIQFLNTQLLPNV